MWPQIERNMKITQAEKTQIICFHLESNMFSIIFLLFFCNAQCLAMQMQILNHNIQISKHYKILLNERKSIMQIWFQPISLRFIAPCCKEMLIKLSSIFFAYYSSILYSIVLFCTLFFTLRSHIGCVSVKGLQPT